MPKKTEEQVITTKEKETILPASPEKLAPTSILTISADADIETPESIEDTNWHELQNAYRTKKILTGTLGGIEKLENDGTIAIVYYKDQRIVIPLASFVFLANTLTEDIVTNMQTINSDLNNFLNCFIFTPFLFPFQVFYLFNILSNCLFIRFRRHNLIIIFYLYFCKKQSSTYNLDITIFHKHTTYPFNC